MHGTSSNLDKPDIVRNSSKDIAHNNIKFVFVIFFVLGLLGVMGYLFLQDQNLHREIKEQKEPPNKKQQKTIVEEEIKNAKDTIERYYYITITREEGSPSKGLDLESFLYNEILEKDEPFKLKLYSDFAYQLSNNGGISNYTDGGYYLITKGISIDDDKLTYLGDNFKVEILEVDNSISPYLESDKYCRNDSDCSIKYSGCRYGGYNKYNSVKNKNGPVCMGGEAQYEDGRLSYEIRGVGCSDPEYSNVSCVDNKCFASDLLCAE